MSQMFVPQYNILDKDSIRMKNAPVSLVNKCPNVIQSFQEIYGTQPDFIAHSPGRINLIGEHIDYTDFSVLPLSIERDMLCAIKIHDPQTNPSITLTNGDSKRFAGRKFDLPLDGSQINIDPSVSDWSNYFKCGLYVAQSYLKEICPEKFQIKPLVGMDVFCQGDVPVGSGLGSSSAIICAVTLGIIRANMGHGYRIPKADLLRITSVAEHYLGVNNGGMDQAASIYGQRGHALSVSFKPELKAVPIEFPKMSNDWDIEFIVADTLVEVNKYDSASTNYNLRVVEVLIAANILAMHYGVVMNYPLDSNVRKGNLRDFMNAYLGLHRSQVSFEINDSIESQIQQLELMLQLTEECLGDKKEGHTADEVSIALDCSKEEFTREYLMLFPIRFQILKIYKRAKHVYSEALRVIKTLQLFKETNDKTNNYTFYHKFGELMNGSQRSCDELYECSSNEIDKICSIALNNGSYGSRLTGAGWGGSTIHLVPNGPNGCNVAHVKDALIEQYYKKQYPDITQETLDTAIIVSKAAPGSCIFEC
ncbi:galactokinase [Maudiozyma exigua]|uniref:Galactokinase n=1 Tax=Maudiozyma exigua TaxID=34358 RepID=A0A9P7BCD5_MAUEX|nr:galactokinase [Kazachstania exigua]